MIRTITISAKISDFDVPFFIGFFQVFDDTDLRKFASIKCKKYGDKYKEDYGKDWLSVLSEVLVCDTDNNTLLNVVL